MDDVRQVFLVTRDEGEDNGISSWGIFSTREKAQEFITTQAEKLGGLAQAMFFDIEEFELDHAELVEPYRSDQ